MTKSRFPRVSHGWAGTIGQAGATGVSFLWSIPDATHSLQRDVIPGCASFASRTTGFKAIDLRIGVSYSTILCREV